MARLIKKLVISKEGLLLYGWGKEDEDGVYDLVAVLVPEYVSNKRIREYARRTGKTFEEIKALVEEARAVRERLKLTEEQTYGIIEQEEG